MKDFAESRREFLKTTGAIAGGFLLWPRGILAQTKEQIQHSQPAVSPSESAAADYTLRIETSPVEIAPKRIISITTYNGQFPGPLLRFKEGQQVTVDVFNDTDTPEQLHWHGQKIPTDVDGAAEEGTPFIPAHGKRRIVFTPRPGWLALLSHSQPRRRKSRGWTVQRTSGAGVHRAETGTGQIRPRSLSCPKGIRAHVQSRRRHGHGFLSPPTRVKSLEQAGESAMKASLAKGMPHGYEVGYGSFTINGRMLGHGEPIRVKQGERVLFHILNGSATEIRSLALPGHTFQVVALDGNPVPTPAQVPVLWLGTAERISAIVEMNHPGVWIMGDLADDDRRHGMGIVVEYAGRGGQPKWIAPAPFHWDYARFAKAGATAPSPDETIEMIFAKQNAAEEGFNRWTINGEAFPMSDEMIPASFHLKQGKRYRMRMRNASDDIHPIHLHRHSFELTSVAGKPTAGIMKDVVMLGGYQEVEVISLLTIRA